MPEDMRRAEIALPDEKRFTHPGLLDYVDPQIDASTGTAGDARGGRECRRLAGARAFRAHPRQDEAALRGARPAGCGRRPLGPGHLRHDRAADGTVGHEAGRDRVRSSGQFRVVRKGLTADDLVIVNGLMRARPGGKVVPQKTELDVPEDLASARGRHAGRGFRRVR